MATAGTTPSWRAFFSTVKSELGEHFVSNGDAKMELFDYIEVFYNQRRRHSTIGYVSPAAFERQVAVRRVLAASGHQAVFGGILQPTPTDDRRSWGIL